MKAYRQGDVLIVRVEDPDRLERFKQNRGWPLYRQPGEGLVLAEGEATGHAHRVRSTRAHMRRYALPKTTHTCLHVPPTGAVVEHEEHDPIHLDPGTYEVRRQSEYAPPERPTRARSTSRAWVAD